MYNVNVLRGRERYYLAGCVVHFIAEAEFRSWMSRIAR